MEIWKVIKKYPKYEASSLGRIRRIDGGIIKAFLNSRTGRLQFDTSIEGIKKRMNVHRAICITFHRNPKNKPTVNHKDGDRLNNKSNNLEWATQSEQVYHAYSIGLIRAYGENNGRAKLTESEIIQIRKSSLSSDSLAEKFNISKRHIRAIINRRFWPHVK